jgi:hypothetical protein
MKFTKIVYKLRDLRYKYADKLTVRYLCMRPETRSPPTPRVKADSGTQDAVSLLNCDRRRPMHR